MKSGLIYAVIGLATTLIADDNYFRITPYLQRPTTDGMTIMWQMQKDGEATLSWSEAQGDSEQGKRKSIKSKPRLADEFFYYPTQTNYPKHHLSFTLPYHHETRIDGLKPDTTYNYTVECGGAVYSDKFRTAPSEDRALRFICYSDSETQPESTGAKVSWDDPADDASKRKYFIDQTTGYASNIVRIIERKPDLILISGDLAEMGSKQVDWDEFWRHNAGELNNPAGSIPYLASPGNHEYFDYDDKGGDTGMRKYLSYFDFMPNDAKVKDDQKERFHSLKYGMATLIFLDLNNGPDDDQTNDTNLYLKEATCRAPSFEKGSEQYKWLERELKKAHKESRFIFVFSHQCPYSVGYHGRFNGENGEVLSGTPARSLVSLISKYGITAWICGHDEIYEHSVVTKLDGKEIAPLHVYDVGFAGDGLRGKQRTSAPNPYEVFRAHKDAPEVWKDGILVSGGKHYGHLEININTNATGEWEATLTPAYIFVSTNNLGQATGFDRREYDDIVTLPAIK